MCLKWKYTSEHLWKNSFKLKLVKQCEFNKIKNLQTITLEEITEIVEKTGPKLQYIDILTDKVYCLGKYWRTLCFFGDHIYYVSDKFQLSRLIEVFSDFSDNIVSLKVEKVKKSEHSMLKKLFAKNPNLSTFKMYSQIPEFNNEIPEFLSSLPNNLNKLELKLGYSSAILAQVLDLL